MTTPQRGLDAPSSLRFGIIHPNVEDPACLIGRSRNSEMVSYP